jgi:DNA-binding response OmpR family regulator
MKKVLLAEDDVTMVGLLTTLLKMEGYQVTVLGEDADIVGAVDETKPDILLMDVHLLHLNGIEELTRLRGSPKGQAVRVLMTSGLDVKIQCMEHGANGFIQKPFMPEELFNKLRSMG